ncbi:MAG: hypothetical protein NZM04_09425 [Methylacidiphilales bacterium]|nr:hypothetical protein [Candidatus Methylacidiphilales bacterium]
MKYQLSLNRRSLSTQYLIHHLIKYGAIPFLRLKRGLRTQIASLYILDANNFSFFLEKQGEIRINEPFDKFTKTRFLPILDPLKHNQLSESECYELSKWAIKYADFLDALHESVSINDNDLVLIKCFNNKSKVCINKTKSYPVTPGSYVNTHVLRLLNAMDVFIANDEIKDGEGLKRIYNGPLAIGIRYCSPHPLIPEIIKISNIETQIDRAIEYYLNAKENVLNEINLTNHSHSFSQ